MSDARVSRLLALVSQLAGSRAERAELLRAALAEIEPDVDDEHRAAAEREAARLAAAGHSVSDALLVTTYGAAAVLGAHPGTLKNWRAGGSGPAMAPRWLRSSLLVAGAARVALGGNWRSSSERSRPATIRLVADGDHYAR